MKHTKKIVCVLIVLTLFLTFGFSVMAEGTKKDNTASEVSSAAESVQSDNGQASSNQVDITNASPEEIEEIGMAAMIEAGLVSNGDVNIVDVTPDNTILPEETAVPNHYAEVFGIAGFVISLVSLISVVILYYLCWSGKFKVSKSKHKKRKKKEME